MLEPQLVELARGRNFATLTVLLSSGQPMTHVMWFDVDDDHVLVNTEVHRAKYRAITRDPRVTVTAWDATNPYHYVETRGRVVGEIRGPQARAHIDALSHRYEGRDYDDARITSERVVLRIAPERQIVHCSGR